MGSVGGGVGASVSVDSRLHPSRVTATGLPTVRNAQHNARTPAPSRPYSALRRYTVLVLFALLACSPSPSPPPVPPAPPDLIPSEANAMATSCEGGEPAACVALAHHAVFTAAAVRVDGGALSDATPWLVSADRWWERACARGHDASCRGASRPADAAPSETSATVGPWTPKKKTTAFAAPGVVCGSDASGAPACFSLPTLEVTVTDGNGSPLMADIGLELMGSGNPVYGSFPSGADGRITLPEASEHLRWTAYGRLLTPVDGRVVVSEHALKQLGPGVDPRGRWGDAGNGVTVSGWLDPSSTSAGLVRVGAKVQPAAVVAPDLLYLDDILYRHHQGG